MERTVMNILFIIPPYLPFEGYDSKNEDFKMPNFTAPYGILSMISYLKNEHNIKIIDFNYILLSVKRHFKRFIINNIEKEINNFKPDFIGISALFDSNFSHLKYIIPAIKQFYPQGKIIVGGGFATSMYNLLLEELPIDIVCYGEGEIPLKKLLEGKSSPALITKENLDVIPRSDFIDDLDEIPILDFSYVDIKQYNNRSPLMTGQNKTEMNIHTSRGCPYNCIFCANGKIHGKRIRYMSIEMVRKTIKHYIDNYNMNVLLIEDDNFLVNKERALKILRMIKEFNIRVVFPNGLSVSGINDDISKAFKEAGVDVVSLAIESGSEHVLKIMQKPLKKEQIPKAVNSLKKFGIRVHAFIIIGIPNEFDEHRKETLDMLINLDIDWAYIFIAIPITGSKLYELCEEHGYLTNKDYDNYNTRECNIKAPGVDPISIKKEAYNMIMVVNFILNSNYRNKRYEVCLPYFSSAVEKYPNNKIARYMLRKTLKCIKNESKNKTENTIRK